MGCVFVYVECSGVCRHRRRVWAKLALFTTYIKRRKIWSLPFRHIAPKNRRFVSLWTKKYMHFGNYASSRVEGTYAKLKRYSQVLIEEVCQMKDKICLAIENEFQEIKTQHESWEWKASSSS